MRTLLVDGDILAYRAAANFQSTLDFGEGPIVVADDIEDAKAAIRDELDELASTLDAQGIAVCLSDDLANWRKDVLPTYKGNRSYAGRPELLYPLKDWLCDTYGKWRRHTLEGDDVMGILATHPYLIKGEKIIVSIDKDMRQIPGKLYVEGKDSLITITPEEADHFHLLQTLTGDPVDNYKGCPGVGPKKAARILEGCEGPWGYIVEAYEARGLTEADALQQARVARICRHTDYDFKERKVKLWTPGI